jgi:hypothetical protein
VCAWLFWVEVVLALALALAQAVLGPPAWRTGTVIVSHIARHVALHDALHNKSDGGKVRLLPILRSLLPAVLRGLLPSLRLRTGVAAVLVAGQLKLMTTAHLDGASAAAPALLPARGRTHPRIVAQRNLRAVVWWRWNHRPLRQCHPAAALKVLFVAGSAKCSSTLEPSMRLWLQRDECGLAACSERSLDLGHLEILLHVALEVYLRLSS